MLHNLAVHRLDRSDAPLVARLLETATETDRRFFTPFPYTIEGVEAALAPMVGDCAYGVSLAEPGQSPELAAFYMLRGLDHGYPSPMYGVFVAPRHRRRGLAGLTMRHAISVCRLHSLPSLMLKVYPDNLPAVQAYTALGFTPLRQEPPQCVMHLKLAA